MQSPQAKFDQISRLLASWPSQAAVDGDEQLRSYLLAVEDYHIIDVESGIDGLIKGTAPGQNPNFLPPPAAVGSECRRQMNLRLDREHRMAKPALPPPDIERSPESRDRVKALVDAAVRNLTAATLDEHAARDKRVKALFDRTNDRFDRERGFSVGDPEDEADAA